MTTNSQNRKKIMGLEELAERVARLKREGQSVALCHGTFDLLHVGHIKHIEFAKETADHVVVTLTADDFVSKGPGRPAFNERLRADQMAALADVSLVAINHAVTAINVINAIQPNFYIKGSDYKNPSDDVTGNIDKETAAVRKHGGEVMFSDAVTFSSSQLLNERFEILSTETKSFLGRIKHSIDFAAVNSLLASLKENKVLVLGDAIIDEYRYTKALGQSGKYNVACAKYESAEKFAGGALAVANHVASLVADVTVLTGLGSYSTEEGFIREKLCGNVSPQFHYFTDAPTIKKSRYLDDDGIRLFEVYEYDQNPVCERFNEELCEWLTNNIDGFDLVIMPDFGNGLITAEMIEICTSKAKKLAINTQVNSGNRGFHRINKYPRADYICLNENELRLAASDSVKDLNEIAREISTTLGAKWVAVTRGSRGILVHDAVSGEDFSIPALSSKVVDRVGAGDAFLAFSAASMLQHDQPYLATFIGAAAAALEVQIVCNREPVNLGALTSYLNTLLK